MDYFQLFAKFLQIGVNAGAFGLEDMANRHAADFNIAQLNQAAKQEDFSAVDTLLQGAQQGGFARMAASAAVAREQVAYAAAGVVSSVGTAARVQSATSNQGELAARISENNAVRAAMGHRQTANKYRAQASNVQEQFDAMHNAGIMGIFG